MINLEFFTKQIQAMDVKSEEFFDLYSFICDKYYNFENPDDFLNAAMALRQYVDKACGNYEEQLIAITKIVEQLMYMEKEGAKSCAGTLAFDNKEYFFTISTDKGPMTALNKVLEKVSSGKFKTKGKKK